MDAFWLVLAGGVTTLAGTFLTHFLAMRKEERMWERQQNAEKEKIARQEEKLKKAELVKIYNDTIRYLSMYLRERILYVVDGELEHHSITSITDEEKLSLYIESEKNRKAFYVEVQRNLWLLSLRLSDADKAELDKFKEQYDAFNEDLIELIMKFARNDSRLAEAPLSTILLPQIQDTLKLTE